MKKMKRKGSSTRIKEGLPLRKILHPSKTECRLSLNNCKKRTTHKCPKISKAYKERTLKDNISAPSASGSAYLKVGLNCKTTTKLKKKMYNESNCFQHWNAQASDL